jgi:tRNA (adenine57-N1/adenine58-N1)-methyltransferase
MHWLSKTTHTKAGDLVQLVDSRYKDHLVRLIPGDQLHTNQGLIHHNDLIGLSWGSRVETHTGRVFLLLQPALDKFLLDMPRSTQIVYPKDIGLILLKLGVGPGCEVLEAGSGSGALTCALASAVGQAGRVYSYDRQIEMQGQARENLEQLGLSDRVRFRQRDIATGFEESAVDALFLDLPDPEHYLSQAHRALKPGGFFGSILPTTNQVIRLIQALKVMGFDAVEVLESFVRSYKPMPNRFRPTDRMVAHTGFLVFARCLLTPDPPGQEP